MFPPFAATWNGKPVIKILEEKSHPAFQDDAGKPVISYSPLMDEFITCEAYPNYWNMSREMRALMLGSKRIRDAIHAMVSWEAREEAKKKKGD